MMSASEEYRVEHRNHLMHVDGCPYCLRRLQAAGEPTPGYADFCLVHMAENCTEPDCYACGNHEMDERGRCADRGCRSLNTPEIVELLAEVNDAPIELKRFMVGNYLAGSLRGD